MTLKQLKAKLDGLSPVQIKFVARTVDSLSNPPETTVRTRGTWLTSSPDWIEYFGLALSVHHGATDLPLGLKSFESVFRNACEHVKWKVEAPQSATRRFLDLVVAPSGRRKLRLSLKSTAAMSMRKDSVHISKLTEAAWIQDVRTQKGRRERTIALFDDYLQQVSRILMLRAFRDQPEAVPHLYQLLEIPTALFRSVRKAPNNVFRNEAAKIPCIVKGKKVATIALDRSDAKISVSRILLDACTVHAEWKRDLSKA